MPAVSASPSEYVRAFPLADSFPLMFLVINQNREIERASDRWLDGCGYTRDAVLGRSCEDVFCNAIPASASDLDGSRVENGPLDAPSHAVLTQTGDTLPCTCMRTDIASEQGHVIGAVLVMHPLEQTKAQDARLQRRSYRLQSCLEGTNAGTWEWNVQTGETIFNERWAEIIGYSLEELAPISIDTWLSLAHPDDLEASSAALSKHWEGQTDFYDIEARMRHKEGHWVWVHDRGRVFTWTADGQPEWMYGTHFSLETQRRETAESEHMKRLLDRTGKVAGVGGWEIDLETHKVTWTAETRRIHAVDDDYIPTVEKGIEFYAPEARGTITKAVERAIQDGSSWDLELPFIRATGERIWVRAVGEVVFQNGVPNLLFGAFQDITERIYQTRELQAAVAALEQSNAELDQFAYVASHDLKAPLRVIANAARWIEEDLGDRMNADIRRSMDLVHGRVGRMDRLLTDLLEHARIGRHGEDTEHATCADIVDDVRNLVDLRDGFWIETGPGLEAAVVPRVLTTKILSNLIGNAVKHHDRENGIVRVAATTTDHSVVLTVEDDGPGIPSDLQARAFSMFQTLRPRDQVEGSGMGLAIVEKAAKTAGGRVTLQSEGRGCVFTIHLPSGVRHSLHRKLTA